MPYAIKCVTEGEQKLAQSIMFKKGASWPGGSDRPVIWGDGQWLIYRPHRRSIRNLRLYQWEDRDRDRSGYTQITMSDLVRLEG